MLIEQVAAIAARRDAQPETRPCGECSTPVVRYRSQRSPGATWFCSNRCSSTHRGRALVASGEWVRPTKPRTGTELPCAQCGAPVYRTAGEYAKGRTTFCSTSCHDQAQRAQRVEVPCQQCGVVLSLAPSTARVRKFCNVACEEKHRLKRSDGRVINGRPVLINSQGYVTIYQPDHPQAGKAGRVLEHRLVMEGVLGRFLTRHEQVDHVNTVKADNRPENLQVMTPREHQHKTQRDRNARLAKLEAENAEYRRRYGSLESVLD